MLSITEFLQLVPTLSLDEQESLRDSLEGNIEDKKALAQAAAEQADIVMMEKRLDDFIAGLIPSDSWENVEARIRASLNR